MEVGKSERFLLQTKSIIEIFLGIRMIWLMSPPIPHSPSPIDITHSKYRITDVLIMPVSGGLKSRKFIPQRRGEGVARREKVVILEGFHFGIHGTYQHSHYDTTNMCFPHSKPKHKDPFLRTYFWACV